MEELDLLGQDSTWQVLSAIFAAGKHTLLTGVLRALNVEDVVWGDTILLEVLSLSQCLREVFNENTRSCLVNQMVNQCLCLSFTVSLLKALLLDEGSEVQCHHVGSLGQCITKCGLARATGSNNVKDLRKHCLSSLSVDFINRNASINVANLSELLVQVNNWLRELLEGTETLLQGLLIIIFSLLSGC